jgi:hypothetical protein
MYIEPDITPYQTFKCVSHIVSHMHAKVQGLSLSLTLSVCLSLSLCLSLICTTDYQYQILNCHTHTHTHTHTDYQYQTLKCNVDLLRIIQVLSRIHTRITTLSLSHTHTHEHRPHTHTHTHTHRQAGVSVCLCLSFSFCLKRVYSEQRWSASFRCCKERILVWQRSPYYCAHEHAPIRILIFCELFTDFLTNSY